MSVKHFYCETCEVVTTCDRELKVTRPHCIMCGDFIDMNPYKKRPYRVWTPEEVDLIAANLDRPHMVYVLAERFQRSVEATRRKFYKLRKNGSKGKDKLID